MTAALTYLVEIELATRGSFVSAGIEEAGRKVAGLERETGLLSSQAKDLAGSYVDFGRSAGGAFMAVGDTVTGLGENLLKLGATTAFGGMMYGAFSLNNELEKTTMSIASILEAAGQVPDIQAGLSKSAGIMSSMRKDAAALPGEFSDLIGIFRTIATPGFNVGMSEEKLEKFSAQAMAAGAVMGLNSAMVGRELSQAMEGRVGGHNIFATRLGIQGADAEKFRKMKPEERVEELTKRLGKYEGAIQAFGSSFEAQSSTLVDNLKKFGGDATLPLFERAKVALAEINAWFDDNQATVRHYSNLVGEYIRDGFDTGKRILLEYGPAFLTFVDNAADRFRGLFTTVRPYLEEFGERLKEILKDPGTIDKIITALKLYAAIKVGSGLLDAGGAVGGVAKAGWALGQAGGGVASGLGPMAGMLGGSAASGLAGGAAEGVEGLMAGAAGAASSLFILAAAAVAVYAAYRVHEEYSAAVKEATEIQKNNTNMMVDNLAAWSPGGEIDTYSKAYKDAVEQIAETSGELAATMFQLAVDVHNAEIEMRKRTQKDMLEMVAGDALQGISNYAQAFAATGIVGIGTSGRLKVPEKPKEKGPPAGGGHTNVYVSMTISSNQAPGQIARRAATEIARLATNRRSSGYAPNFTARNR